MRASKIITFTVLLLIASLLLSACGAKSSDVPKLADEPVVTPEPHEYEDDDSGVYDYVFDDGYIESEYEDEDVDENGNEIDDTTAGRFEIYNIEGTTDTLGADVWERMLLWRERAVLLAGLHRDTVIINMNPAENVVYLTFDDGPDPNNTVSVINTLIEYGVSATFFFTGENIARHGDVVRKAHEAGFAIGLHGYGHKSFQELTAEEIITELNESNDLLEAITDERATIMRPPYGAAGNEEIKTISDLNLKIYLWSLDTLDWAQTDANEILRNIKDYLRPGEIILMHAFSGQKLVPEILPSIIEFIRDEGFEMRALP